MSSERFQIVNEKDHALNGIIETAHPKKRQPAIIFLNGFLDTMESSRKKLLVELFQKDGFVTVRFDYTFGFGAGSGDIASFTLSSQMADISRVIDYVVRRGYVDPEKVILFGHCYGGMAGILQAAFDDRVTLFVSLSAPYEFSDTQLTRFEENELNRMRLKRYFHIYSDALEREVRIDYHFFEDGMKKDMARAVRNFRQPILVIHGGNDESIPLRNAEEIYNRVAGPRELYIVKGMGHHPTLKDIKELFPVVRAFIKKHLKV